jgi:tetratricopeptide (TPR) repeat protein
MMRKLGLILVIIVAANCGSPARKATPEIDSNKVITKEQGMAQSQAYEHFFRADLLEKSGNYEKAADEYRLALVFDPESNVVKRNLVNIYYNYRRYEEALDISLSIKEPDAQDLITMANCYAFLGNQKKAIEYFKLTVDSVTLPEPPNRYERAPHGGQNQGSTPAIMYYFPNQYLAGYYSDKHDYKKAEYYFRRSLGSDTTDIRWLYKAAAFYRENGQVEKAISIYKQMAQNDSISNSGYLGLASIKEMEKDTAGADSIYQVVARKNWDDAQLLAILSQALIRLDDLPAAIAIARRVSELNPNDYFGARRLALMMFSMQDYRGCDSVLAALSLEVTDDPILFYYRGRIAQLDSNYIQAENYYSHSLSIDDTLSEVWVSLAFTRFFMGDTIAAAATFDSALTACADDTVRILFFTGMFNNQRHQYATAIACFDRVLAADPRNINTLFNLGAACERNGRFTDAEKAFERLLSIQPDYGQALNYLGFMWADKGIKLDQAQKMIGQALKADPENGAYLDSYAWVLFKKGKFKDALKYQEKAMRFSSEDAVLYDHLGDIRAAMGDFAAAKENWRKASEIDPSNETIKNKLTK